MRKILLCLSVLLSCFAFYKITNSDRPFLTIIGRIVVADGLGRQAIELAETLQDEVSTNLIPTARIWRDVPEKIKQLLRKNQKLGTFIICQEPINESFRKLKTPVRPDQLRIAYTMSESTKLPTDHINLLNRYFDAAVVPDPWLIEIYKNSGVEIPLFVLPLGRDFSPFLNCDLKQKRGSPFTFAALGSGIERKNLPTLIRAFRKAFGNRTDVRLLINCRSRYICDSKIIDEVQKIQTNNVIFTRYTLSNLAYLDLLKTVDCYVNISKSEGFSIQPREAMALGIPVILTDNTAQHTICKSGLVRSVPSELLEPAVCEFTLEKDLGFYFGCDEEAVAEALLDVERNYDSFLEKSAEARQWASQYDFSQLRPLYCSLVKPKKLLLGEENKITSDYLMTNSNKFYKKYKKLILD